MANNFRMSNFSEPTLYNAGVHNNSITVGSVPPIPPVLPPRPFQNQRYGGWNNGGGYAGGYGGYGYSGYSGYGSGYGGFGPSYGSYGTGYGGMYSGYNRMGHGGMYGQGNLESRFIQYAEESSRPAFQSIESVVGAFGGIASMLDSTFMAMTTSFRAILGVAENFGRLRSLFAQFWSTFAIFRTINWIYRKMLSVLGLSKHDPKKYQAWADALSESQKGNDIKNTSTWPILVFLGIITSAPYIIYKLFGNLNNSILEKAADPTTWNNPLLAAAMFDLSSSNPNELSFRSMQSVKIAPLEIQNQMNLMNSGWLLASVDNKISGLVPANYVRIIKGNGNFNGTSEINSSKQDFQNMNSAFKDTADSKMGEDVTPGTEVNPIANSE